MDLDKNKLIARIIYYITCEEKNIKEISHKEHVPGKNKLIDICQAKIDAYQDLLYRIEKGSFDIKGIE